MCRQRQKTGLAGTGQRIIGGKPKKLQTLRAMHRPATFTAAPEAPVQPVARVPAVSRPRDTTRLPSPQSEEAAGAGNITSIFELPFFYIKKMSRISVTAAWKQHAKQSYFFVFLIKRRNSCYGKNCILIWKICYRACFKKASS